MGEGGPWLSATLAVTIRGGRRNLLGAVGCRAAARTTLHCLVDEDGGSFTLRQEKGRLRLGVPERVLVAPLTGNHDADFQHRFTIYARDDHQTFLMPAARGGACDVEWPPVND